MNNERSIPIPALWALRVAVALTCVGMSAKLLLYGGPVLSWLWMNLGWSESAAIHVEHAAAYALLACIPFLFWRAAWFVPKLVAAWLFFTAIAMTLIGTWHVELILPSHAARYLAPLALAAWHYSETDRRRELGEWLLRVGAGVTFIFHGIEALLAKARFIDYLIDATDELAGVDLAQDTAVSILLVIGVVDIAVGAAIMIPKRWRLLALWLAFWGFLTAAARVVYLGWDNYPETLIRVANGAAPLTLWLLWAERSKRDEANE